MGVRNIRSCSLLGGAMMIGIMSGCTLDRSPESMASSAQMPPAVESMPASAPAQSTQAPPAQPVPPGSFSSPQATTSTIDASGKVSLAGGRVSFVLPPGFTPMTAAEIARKFPHGTKPPQHAYANDRRSVTIAVTFSPARVAPEQLPELKSILQQSLERSVPNAQWVSQEMTTINNTPWAHLEFVTQALDTKVHNDAYFTSFDGRMLGVNFNSIVAQHAGIRDQLQKTRDSIVVR